MDKQTTAIGKELELQNICMRMFAAKLIASSVSSKAKRVERFLIAFYRGKINRFFLYGTVE